MNKEKQTIKLKDVLSGVQKLFLDESRELNFQGEKEQALLRKTWETISLLYPESRNGQTTICVPSDKLVELGLVSSLAAEQIIQRRDRKMGYRGQISAGDEPQNVVTIDRSVEGFRVTKTYVGEEQNVGQESLLRRDKIVRERLLLTKSGVSFTAQLEVTEGESHLHALDRTWFPIETAERSFESRPITARDLNRTLALLVEGLSPGYLRPLS